MLFQNRHEEAWKIVAKLHHRANDPDGLFAREEFTQMSQQVKADQAAIKSETVMDLFRKPSYRKRMVCAFLMMYAAQSTGNLVIYSKFSYCRLVSMLLASDFTSRLQCHSLQRSWSDGCCATHPWCGLLHNCSGIQFRLCLAS